MSSNPGLTAGRALALACAFEAALLVIAYAAGWLAGIDPLASLAPGSGSTAIGLLAVMPMVGLLWWGLQHPQHPLGRPTAEAREFVANFFRDTGWAGFALVAFLAGLCEEALFRGFLQVFIAGFAGEFQALLAASVLFGLAHAVSLAYAVVATIIGLYLGALFLLTDGLLAPVVCHAVYDFIALVWLSRSVR